MKLFEFSIRSLAIASAALVISACTGTTETSSSDVGTVSSVVVSSAISSVQPSSSSVTAVSSEASSSSSSQASFSSSTQVPSSSSSQAPSSSSVASSSLASSSSMTAVSSTPSAGSGDVDLGRQLYAEQGCLRCHGDKGQGGSFPIDIVPPYSRISGESFSAISTYLAEFMPNFDGFMPTSCVGECADNITAYMLAGFPAPSGGGSGSGSPISASAQAARVAAGKKAYAENACGLCHKDNGSTLVQFGSGDNVKSRSLKNCPSCSSYQSLVTSISLTMPKGDAEFGPTSCTGDCAKATADYIWVEVLGGTLTTEGGTLPPVSTEIGLDTLRVKSYEAIAADYERVFGEVPAGLEASEGAFRKTPGFWYQENALGAVSLNILANAAVEACQGETMPAANPTAVRTACADWASRMWLRDASAEELDSCVDTALNLTSGLSDSKKQLEFACASMMISIPALTY